RFYDNLCTYFIPLQVSRALFSSNSDLLTIDYQFSVSYFNFTFELSVGGVIFQHISHVFSINKIIDAYNLNIISFLGCSENQSADPSETINTNFNLCHNLV